LSYKSSKGDFIWSVHQVMAVTDAGGFVEEKSGAAAKAFDEIPAVSQKLNRNW